MQVPNHPRITIDPQRMFGKPSIRDLRFTVAGILDYLASGMTEQEILDDFPCADREHSRRCRVNIRLLLDETFATSCSAAGKPLSRLIACPRGGVEPRRILISRRLSGIQSGPGPSAEGHSITAGNCSTRRVETMLRSQAIRIGQFVADD